MFTDPKTDKMMNSLHVCCGFIKCTFVTEKANNSERPLVTDEKPITEAYCFCPSNQNTESLGRLKLLDNTCSMAAKYYRKNCRLKKGALSMDL